MKKLLLSLIAVSALAFTTQAQTEKGKFMLGGNVEFDSNKPNGASKSNTIFNIVPSVGYFVTDNFAIGTGVGYESAKNHVDATTVNGVNIGGSTTKNQAFVVAPFARYYKGITEQFKFFGQLSVPMAFGNTKVGDVDGNNYAKVSKYNNVGVALSPGFAFFPSKKFGIEFSVQGISYNDNTLKNNNGDKIGGNKDFNIGANFFAPKLGVQFYL
ncbi:outer membrane beta-barrel protein [Pedobacter cryoconitis]|uniref:Outer membrane protein n=1 Tax=Pedobacter cryoconitis TaxID=188932 RepID=A0A7X0J2N5_9SPHI|nr:outer membrane beta-barrel protein [Pedobacter cryoconitis]MBB6499960.1 outer membrane protein [Pedobacter cryoconitis]